MNDWNITHHNQHVRSGIWLIRHKTRRLRSGEPLSVAFGGPDGNTRMWRFIVTSSTDRDRPAA